MAFRRLEILDNSAVITAYPVVCPEPHKSVIILMYRSDGIIGQTVLHCQQPDIFVKESTNNTCRTTTCKQNKKD